MHRQLTLSALTYPALHWVAAAGAAIAFMFALGAQVARGGGDALPAPERARAALADTAAAPAAKGAQGLRTVVVPGLRRDPKPHRRAPQPTAPVPVLHKPQAEPVRIPAVVAAPAPVARRVPAAPAPAPAPAPKPARGPGFDSSG